MKQNIEIFLEEYTKIEGMLKKSDKYPDTVLEFENNLDTETAEKLRLCRQIRNYCRHHDDYKKFVDAADGMIQFIKSVQYMIEADFAHVKDKTKRIPSLTVEDTISDAMRAVEKAPAGIVPVVYGDGVLEGIVTMRVLINALNNGSRKTAKIFSLIGNKVWQKEQNYKTVVTTDPLPELKSADELILVIDQKGKYKGVLEV